MSFCSFSTEYNKNGVVNVDSSFVTNYLPEASGDAVRVYLFGLFACGSKIDYSISSMAIDLNMETSEVINYFRYWEEYDLVSIISEDPFEVRYLPISHSGKPRKFKPEKYSEFTSAIQALLPERMISTSEYSAYFAIMEDFSIKPEAMLMICKYCIDLKGTSIGYKYIIAVARDFAYRGIVTTELIEKELSDYITKSSDIAQILSALGIKRKPEIDDSKLFNKWIGELGYENRVILFIAKKCNKKNMASLDKFILELYANKLFTEQEIESYLKQKQDYRELSYKICKQLSLFMQDIDPVVENYIAPWTSKGYNGDSLEFVANYCFKKNRRTLEDMNTQINNLYAQGIVTLSSIVEYFKGIAKQDEFIRTLLSLCGLDRRPTASDRELVKTWNDWGFSDEMIEEACKEGNGAMRPFVYVNAVLSDWKSKKIFTKDKIPETPHITNNNKNPHGYGHFANERNYTKEELDALIDSVDDIKF